MKRETMLSGRIASTISCVVESQSGILSCEQTWPPVTLQLKKNGRSTTTDSCADFYQNTILNLHQIKEH